MVGILSMTVSKFFLMDLSVHLLAMARDSLTTSLLSLAISLASSINSFFDLALPSSSSL
jgi:hypothetical protein